MFAYAVRRLLQFIPTILVITLIIFMLLNVLPGNAALMAVGQQDRDIDIHYIEMMKKDWGLDKPLWLRYVTYIKDLATGNLGLSFLRREPVTDLVLARMWPTLKLAIVAMLIAVSLGTLIGALSGYFGGIVDTILMRFTDFALAFPRIFFLILLAILLRPRITTVVLVIGLLAWMPVARLVRGSFLEIKNQQFIEAAQALGAGNTRIMFRHILPNALGPIIVAASLGVADAIISESGLSFLGLGIQPPTATWGNMLKNALDQIFDAPWTAIVPGFMIFLTVLSINYIGDGLRDAFDPHRIEQKMSE